MAEPSFADQMATLNSTLGAIEVRLALGRAPVEGLESFKSALDDIRLRLWGLLSANDGPESRGFQEQFRIRRAIFGKLSTGGQALARAIQHSCSLGQQFFSSWRGGCRLGRTCKVGVRIRHVLPIQLWAKRGI